MTGGSSTMASVLQVRRSHSARVPRVELARNSLRSFWPRGVPTSVGLLTSDLVISCPVHWEDLRSQLVDLLGHTHLSLTTLKRKASDKLEHLLSAFLKVLAFISNDENEVSTKSELNNIQKYIVRSLNQLEE